MGLIYVVFGLIAGLIFAIVSLMGSAVVQTNTDMYSGMMTLPAGVGAGLGAAAIIIMPILYGIGGWISGIVIAALYNLMSSWIGAVEVQTDIKRV